MSAPTLTNKEMLTGVPGKDPTEDVAGTYRSGRELWELLVADEGSEVTGRSGREAA